MSICSKYNVFSPVEQPCWDFEVRGVLHHQNESFQLIGIQITRSRSHQLMLLEQRVGRISEVSNRYLLVRLMSAFLQTTLAYRLPTPLICVKAYVIFILPSTFVFSNRRMCWNYIINICAAKQASFYTYLKGLMAFW